VEARREDRAVLRNLLELCLHDLSEYSGQDVDEHGLYGYDYLDPYWTETGRHAFLVRVGGKLAGFALVRDVSAEVGTAAHSMAEFFIMRKYRRRGIGRVVAQRLFDRFPGRWRVAQEEGNRAAQAFWMEVISGYTGGRPRELQEEGWQGPTLQFESRGRGATAGAG
jgi:predicted acetyltransferase